MSCTGYSVFIGFVEAFKKASSGCGYTYTVMKALHHVAEALNVGLQVVKTPRTSGPGERVADFLSKGKFKEAFNEAETFREAPSFIPKTLTYWLENPRESRILGQAIIEEMSSYTSVIRWGVEKIDEVNLLVKRGKRKLSD